MLVSLHVKNLALIDETEVYFGNGLNILTGETGAGKSIIIGSVNLALGARADKELIRTGAEYALVELVFQITNEKQLKLIQDMDIPMEEDGTVLVQRKILPNRNIIKICGENATTKMIKELAEIVIDIHGQHEHQSLFSIRKHLELLDDFAREELNPVKERLLETYKVYTALQKELEKCKEDTVQEKEISLAEFEIDEIERAQIQSGEDIALEADYSKMQNSHKIIKVMAAISALVGNDDTEGAVDLIGRALRDLNSILPYDSLLEPMDETLNSIDMQLSDLKRSITGYMEELNFDPKLFSETEERLNILNRLKTKYGQTLQEIFDYQNTQKEKLELLLNYENYISDLKKKISAKKKELDTLCVEASDIRKRYASQLSEKLTRALVDLNFLEVDFKIEVRKMEEQYHTYGFDEVEFLISTNPGEPLKSLRNVASGGELSRIMLALKTVIAEKDDIETLIFDEIDAGISGKTAWKVSEQLAVLGKGHQIICITHLPQIASMADHHFVIEKQIQEGSTITSINEIRDKAEIEEIARLLGGDQITKAVIENALEMKSLAAKAKGQV